MPSTDLMVQIVAGQRRRRRWIIVLAVSLAVVFIGGPITMVAIIRAVAGAKLRAIRAELRAAGYPVTAKELDAWYKAPAGANAASILGPAFAALTFDEEQMKILRMTQQEWEAAFTGDPPRLTDELRAAMEAVLAANAAPIKSFHEAAAIDGSRYPIDLTAGPNVLLPGLGSARRAADLLELEALLHTDDGDIPAAATSLHAALRIADSFRNEPILISQLVRLAIQAKTVAAIERIVNLRPMDDAALVNLTAAIARGEEPVGVSHGYLGELCLSDALYDMPISQLRMWVDGVPRNASGFGRAIFVPMLYLYRGSGLMELDRAQRLAIMQDYLRVTTTGIPLHERGGAARQIEQRVASAMLMTRAVTASLARATLIEVRTVTQLRLARVALTVERYRLAEGRLPQDLNDLAPRFIETLPDDPFTGRALIYQILDRGFVIYSVGEDGVDDGGLRMNAQGQAFEPGTDVPFIITR